MNILSNADVSLAFKTYTIYKPGKSPVCEQHKDFLVFFKHVAPVYRDCALDSTTGCFVSFKVYQMKGYLTRSQVQNS